MLTRLSTTAAALALASLSALAMAQAGFSIKRVAKVDEVIRYRMEITGLQVSGAESMLVVPLIEKVHEIKPDGTYSLEHSMEPGLFTSGGVEHPTVAQPGSLTVYKANNELIELQGPGLGRDGEPQTPEVVRGRKDAYRVATLQLVVDPGKPLSVGESWTHEFQADPNTGAPAARGEYKVLGEEKIDAFHTLKIKAVVRETVGAEPAALESTVWLSKTDGSLVRSEMKWIRAPFPGVGPSNVAVILTREVSPKA